MASQVCPRQSQLGKIAFASYVRYIVLLVSNFPGISLVASQVCLWQSQLGSGAAALPVPRVVAAQPEASKAACRRLPRVSPGRSGVTPGRPKRHPWAPKALPLGALIQLAVISHAGVRKIK